MAISTAIIKFTNKIFPKVVHPFNLQNQGKETYAKWQYRKGEDTIRFFLEARTAEEMFQGKQVLDMGCGEGKDAVFLAKCGYAVTAFDLSSQGIEKAKHLAEHNHVDVRFFKADLFDYNPDSEYDIIFSSGVLHFIPQPRRRELCDNLKAHTAAGGINAMNVFVRKPFITRSWDNPEDEKLRHPWYSGELFGYYHDWLFHTCREEVFDCNSGGVPHKHCMDTLIAQKLEAGVQIEGQSGNAGSGR